MDILKGEIGYGISVYSDGGEKVLYLKKGSKVIFSTTKNGVLKITFYEGEYLFESEFIIIKQGLLTRRRIILLDGLELEKVSNFKEMNIILTDLKEHNKLETTGLNNTPLFEELSIFDILRL